MNPAYDPLSWLPRVADDYPIASFEYDTSYLRPELRLWIPCDHDDDEFIHVIESFGFVWLKDYRDDARGRCYEFEARSDQP